MPYYGATCHGYEIWAWQARVSGPARPVLPPSVPLRITLPLYVSSEIARKKAKYAKERQYQSRPANEKGIVQTQLGLPFDGPIIGTVQLLGRVGP